MNLYVVAFCCCRVSWKKIEGVQCYNLLIRKREKVLLETAVVLICNMLKN